MDLLPLHVLSAILFLPNQRSGWQGYGPRLLNQEDPDLHGQYSFHIIHPSGDHSTRLNPYTVHWNAPATRQFLKNRQAVPSYLGNIWQVPEPVHWQYSCQKHLCTRYHNGRKAGQNPFFCLEYLLWEAARCVLPYLPGCPDRHRGSVHFSRHFPVSGSDTLLSDQILLPPAS